MNNQPVDQPTTVRVGEELNTERLAAYLRAQLPNTNGPLSIEQFPGGMSNLTYLLRVGADELVLRRPPFGATIRGGHDMAREHRILSALGVVYPHVPQPLAFCDDLAVLGAPFYIMERVRGVVLRPPLPAGLHLEPDAMRRTCLALIDTLVTLHAIDYAAAGLGELGKPDGYTVRQVAGWTRRYDAARTDDCPNLAPICAWLATNTPAQSAASLIHNDFKYDNLVLDPQELARIVAVLDWEMATVGDPLTDLGTTLAYWAEPGDPAELRQHTITDRPGNLNRQQLLERYAERSGRDCSNMPFYFVYGLFKNAVIVLQIYQRYKQGLTRDPRFATLIGLIRVYATMADRAIASGQISGLYSL